MALVDDADYELVSRYRWTVNEPKRVAYAQTSMRRPRRTTISMHALIMGQPGIDHVNLNGLDNRRANLRPATLSQNGANRRSAVGSTSRFKGVSWYSRYGCWTAHIMVNKHARNLGNFADEIEAARAYDVAALAAWGEYARLNFPR